MERKSHHRPTDAIRGHRYKRSRDLAQALSEPIRRGEMPVGAGLPTTRHLAVKYGVSINTVQLALRELEARGLIRCVPRQGAVVTSATEKPGVEDSSSNAPATEHQQIGVLTNMSAEEDLAQAPWSMRVLHAAEEVLFDAGYSLTLLPYAENAGATPSALVERVDRLSARLVGILYFADRRLDAALQHIEKRGIPWVSVNRPHASSSHNFVATDNVSAGRLVARCFGKLGFQRVVVLSDDVNLVQSTLEKVTGFCQGWLEERSSTTGLEMVQCAGISETDGYAAVKSLLAAGKRFEGLFTAGDHMAIGAMRALIDSGLSVPDDVGVVGSTGLPIGERCSPSLSVVSQPMEQIGRQAASMLIQMVREGLRTMIGRRIRGQFIIRESLRVNEQVRAELSALSAIT